MEKMTTTNYAVSLNIVIVFEDESIVWEQFGEQQEKHLFALH